MASSVAGGSLNWWSFWRWFCLVEVSAEAVTMQSSCSSWWKHSQGLYLDWLPSGLPHPRLALGPIQEPIHASFPLILNLSVGGRVCKHVCVGVYMNVCVYIWVKVQCQMLSSITLHLIFGERVSHRAYQFSEAGWPVSIRDLPVYASLMLGLQTWASPPGFLRRCWASDPVSSCLQGKSVATWTSP